VKSLPPEVERRRRLVTRAFPLVILALVAFVAGMIVGSEPPPEKQAAQRFVSDWVDQDFAAMHAELSQPSQQRYSAADLRSAYIDAEEKATLRTLDPGEAKGPDTVGGRKVVTVPIRVGTVAFGDFDSDLALPFADGGIVWDPHLGLPRAAAGRRAGREHRFGAPRNDQGARWNRRSRRDHRRLARPRWEVRRSTPQVRSASRTPPSSPPWRVRAFPPAPRVGISGLERAFNSHLAGKPGGQLIAQPPSGGPQRILAQSDPTPGLPLKTTIDPALQQTAVAGLAGRAGGVAVLDARNGAVRALAGSAFSAPQPPGSTFKVVTTTAALQKGVVALDDQFPITNGINVGGRFIANAHDEYCGGSFTQAFAESCNAVFAPLGPKIGQSGMVTTAQRYGFNAKPTLYDQRATKLTDPPEPSIPQEIGDDLDLGVTAIGQGQVLATPLEMASIAQTVGLRGIRMPTPIVVKKKLQADAGPVRVMSPKIASQLRDLMIGVVTSGTGTAAALPGVQVAGKTGTAELGPKPGAPSPPPGQQPQQAVDAWFTSFAPANETTPGGRRVVG